MTNTPDSEKGRGTVCTNRTVRDFRLNLAIASKKCASTNPMTIFVVSFGTS